MPRNIASRRSSLKNIENSFPPLILAITDVKSKNTGLVTAAANLGFCRSNALSSVEPDLGNPDMKWNFALIAAPSSVKGSNRTDSDPIRVLKAQHWLNGLMIYVE